MSIKKKNLQFYEEYHLKRNRLRPQWITRYWKYFRGSVLEVGCGTIVPENLKEYFYVGLDMSKIAIEKINKMGANANGVIGDGEYPPPFFLRLNRLML